jgi:LCP family protein required for cell wall assembly
MQTSKRFILLIVTAIFLMGCGITGMVGASPSQVLPVAQQLLVQAPPGSSPTPTSFLPLPPTPTYIPTNFPTSTPVPTATPTTTPKPTAKPTQGYTKPISKSWGDYPGPSIWPDMDIPGPTGLLAQPKGQLNILLLGSDVRPSDPSFRTDTILLLTINPVKGTVNITSFPRDLYVYIPGWTMQRINTAMGYGGFAKLAQTFEYNFGVRPDHYVLINFASFKRIVNLLGGIDVDVAVTLTDHRDGYGDYYTMRAGTRHMDGETALWYVRARYSTNDFDRGRRQQEVIVAIFRKLLSRNALANAQSLYKTYNQTVDTDMGFSDIKPLLPVALNLKVSRIHHYYISPAEVYNWITSQGAMVLVPVRDRVLQVMHDALNSP